METSRFAGVLLLSGLAAGFGCTSPNPAPVEDDIDLSAPDLGDLGPSDLGDQRDIDPPADLPLVCGYGQVAQAGKCSCDTEHPVSCGEENYCCGTGQQCLAGKGPRGETRCSLPPTTLGRSQHVMAYDKVRDVSVLRFGVCENTGVESLCEDQWRLTPVTWEAPTVVNPPTPRYDATFIWDDNAKGLLLWGGLTTLGKADLATDEMWLWDGSAWIAKKPNSGPAARYAHAMAFDSDRKVAVLFGGEIGLTAQDDTWEWDNTKWTLRTTTTTPQVRSDHRMVYDARLKRIVMHGGFVSGFYSRETWSYDGNDWRLFADDMAVPLRVKFGMAYDEKRQVTVVFGGETLGGNITNDTWEFDGGRWTKKASLATPTRRVYPVLFYDAGRKQVLMFGGDPVSSSRTKDLWAYDGTNWTQLY